MSTTIPAIIIAIGIGVILFVGSLVGIVLVTWLTVAVSAGVRSVRSDRHGAA